MRRRNWFTGQLVTEGQMDTAFADVEIAQWAVPADFGFYGVLSGHEVAEHAPANMTVDVSSGASYTPEGKRCRSGVTNTVRLDIDVDGIGTQVVTPTYSKVLSIFIVFDRGLTTPEYDVSSTLVYTIEDESYAFEVIQGSEALSPSPPALRADAVLLADVTISNGQTTIVDADISYDRREALITLTRSDFSKSRYGRVQTALQTVLEILDQHIDGAAANHTWTDIEASITNVVTWANGATWFNTSPTTVGVAIEDGVVGQLAAMTNPSGAHLVGVYSSSYQSGAGVPTLAASTLFTRLESMRDATNIYMPALGSWPAGDNPTNPAASVLTSVTKVVANLAARASATDQGVRRIGLYGTGFGLASWQAIGAGTVYDLFTALNQTGGTYDGAAHIGAKASGGLSGGTVRSQLDGLDGRTTTNTTNISTNTSNIATITTKLTNLYYRHPTPATSASPSYTTMLTTATDIATIAFASPSSEEVVVDDVIEISFVATATNTTQDAYIFLAVKQVSDGSPVAITGARVRIPAGTTVPVSITASFPVTEAGILYVVARAAKSVLGGTLSIVEAYRLEAKRMRRAS